VLVAVGLNQKGATVADREVLALPPDAIHSALAGYAALDAIEEVAVMSTCYRVEIYAATRCPAAATLALRQALNARAGRELPLFELHGEEAFRHLVRVASSLESAILGEPQILGQVKDAFQRAIELGVAGKELTAVLNRALASAKRVRTETAVGRAGISWGHAAATLAEKVLGPIQGRCVVVVGAGEMARLSAQHLRDQGARIVVLNRTLANGEALAQEVGGTARPLDALEEVLAQADVVASAAPVARRRSSQAMTRLAARGAGRWSRGPRRPACHSRRDGRDLRRLSVRRGRPRSGDEGGDERRAAAWPTPSGSSRRRSRSTSAQRRSAGGPLIQEMRSRASAIARERSSAPSGSGRPGSSGAWTRWRGRSSRSSFTRRARGCVRRCATAAPERRWWRRRWRSSSSRPTSAHIAATPPEVSQGGRLFLPTQSLQ
jgi:glutamyl-tRNA reductase